MRAPSPVCVCSRADLLAARILQRLTPIERHKLNSLRDRGQWTPPNLKPASIDECAEQYRCHIARLWHDDNIELPNWLKADDQALLVENWPTPKLIGGELWQKT